MRKFKLALYLLFPLIVSLLAACSSNKDEVAKTEGVFVKNKPDQIISQYKRNSDEAFYVALDFELQSGRVDFEIKGPDSKTVFKGYANYEDGKTYRQLIYPANFLGGHMSHREAVEDEAKFNFLQFDAPAAKGVYQLIITPSSAEGEYDIEWHSKLPRK